MASLPAPTSEVNGTHQHFPASSLQNTSVVAVIVVVCVVMGVVITVANVEVQIPSTCPASVLFFFFVTNSATVLVNNLTQKPAFRKRVWI